VGLLVSIEEGEGRGMMALLFVEDVYIGREGEKAGSGEERGMGDGLETMRTCLPPMGSG
jgi:hypothetical protein